MKRYISAGRAITYNKPEAEAALKNAIKWVQDSPEFQDAYPEGRLRISKCTIERFTRPVHYEATIKIDFSCPSFVVSNDWNGSLDLYGIQVPATSHIDIDYFCDDSLLNNVLNLLEKRAHSSDLDYKESFDNFGNACDDLCNKYGMSGELSCFPDIELGDEPMAFYFMANQIDSFGDIPKSGFITDSDPEMHVYTKAATHMCISTRPLYPGDLCTYPINKEELSYDTAIELLEPQFEAAEYFFNKLNKCIDLYDQLEPIYLQIRDQLIDKWGNVASEYAWQGLKITTSIKANEIVTDGPVLLCEGKPVEDVSDLKKVRKSLDGKFRRLFKKSQNAIPEYDSPMTSDSYSFSD